MLPFGLPPPPPGYGILTNIRLAERPMLEARESILRYGHQRLGAGTPDTDINMTLLCHGRAGDLVPVRVHRTVLCCQSPFLMELVHSAKSEDGGDTVIILPDVEVDAMFSVLDVLYSGQSSVSTDYDKFQLTRLLLRLGLDSVARSLTLQLATASGVRDENLNNLVTINHPEDFKGPALVLPPTQPPPDIDSPGTSSPNLQTACNQTEAGAIHNPSLTHMSFDPDTSMPIGSPKLTSTPLQSSTSQGEHVSRKDKNDIEKEKCVQEINVKMREEFAKLKLKDDRRKKRRQEEVTTSKAPIVQKPKSFKEKKFKSNKRPRNDSTKVSDPKLAVLQPYPLRNDCRIALGLRNIVPKAPEGKVYIKPTNMGEVSKTSNANGCVKTAKRAQFPSITPRSADRSKNMVIGKKSDATTSDTNNDQKSPLPSETPDSSSAPPLGYRKEAGRKTVRIDKLCPICKHNIAGTGANWRIPLYSHIARKHFPDELIKNYAMGEEANLSCRLCGKSEKDLSGSRGQFLYHLGAKHRLVEMFISLKEIEAEAAVAVKDDVNESISKDNFADENDGEVSFKDTEVDDLLDSASTTLEAPLPDEDDNDDNADDAFKTACEELSASLTPQRKKIRVSGAHSGPTPDNIRDELFQDPESRSKRPRVVPKRFQDCSTNPADSDIEDQDPKVKSSPSQKSKRIITKTKSGKIECPHCSKTVTLEPVLESHLLSRHFRPDCEAAIREILERAGGKCPLCPGNKGWAWGGAGNEAKALDWNMFIHFSRTHRITQGLTYSDNKPNQENVKKILSRFEEK